MYMKFYHRLLNDVSPASSTVCCAKSNESTSRGLENCLKFSESLVLLELAVHGDIKRDIRAEVRCPLDIHFGVSAITHTA